MRTKDTYTKEPTIIVYPDSPRTIAKVYHPDITDEERKRRMAIIASAAENLLKNYELVRRNKNKEEK